jgi:hypothetical protein
MHQSPTAIFADIVARPVSGLTSAFDSCGRIAFPRPQGHSGFRIRRHSFTVAGAAPGLVLGHRRTRTGFPFHSPSFSVNTKINSKAPDNFGSDAIRTHGNWQAGGGSAADFFSRLLD